MSQPQQMNMGAMGGPVGGAQPPQQQAAGTPTNGGAMNANDTADTIKRLNTYIYDYFLRNQHYDIARAMHQSGSLELYTQKQSPGQRQNQPNGIDDTDADRPKDLPEPALMNTEGPFLQDWWFQFWDIYNSRRNVGGKPSTLGYLTAQRAGQKQRGNLMGGMDPAMQNMRNMSMMSNGMMPNDLKKAAMQNAGAGNVNPQQMAQMQRMRAAQGQQQMMPGQQMERSNSQMEMNGPRSGSPGSGDAPSPKRQRLDGNVQQMGPRPGQQGQMPNSQGMPPNVSAAMGPAGAQGSPLSQAGMDSSLADFGPNGAAMRPGMVPNPGVAAGGQAAPNGGNHALQDYQMQLMLLEQQNKKRLLMARQEQDSMTHPGIPPNANEMMNRQMMPNGTFPGGAQPMPPNMMPGPPGGPGQQPGQAPPNMTPRQGNQAMPPPPAPQPTATGGTQPSSPAAAPAPPTPNQGNKAKPGAKKDNKNNKSAQKKGGQTGATPASEAEQPPTPTPATPITPMNQNSFQKQQIAPNGGMPNGAPQQQPPNQPGNGAQAPGPEMNGPFGGSGNLVGDDQFGNMNMDFADPMGATGDVLDNFDFDSFLNTDDGGLNGFDNFSFDTGLEAGGDGMGQ